MVSIGGGSLRVKQGDLLFAAQAVRGFKLQNRVIMIAHDTERGQPTAVDIGVESGKPYQFHLDRMVLQRVLALPGCSMIVNVVPTGSASHKVFLFKEKQRGSVRRCCKIFRAREHGKGLFVTSDFLSYGARYGFPVRQPQCYWIAGLFELHKLCG